MPESFSIYTNNFPHKHIFQKSQQWWLISKRKELDARNIEGAKHEGEIDTQEVLCARRRWSKKKVRWKENEKENRCLSGLRLVDHIHRVMSHHLVLTLAFSHTWTDIHSDTLPLILEKVLLWADKCSDLFLKEFTRSNGKKSHKHQFHCTATKRLNSKVRYSCFKSWQEMTASGWKHPHWACCK